MLGACRKGEDVTYVELDMKNQYTNLGHEDIRKALRGALKEVNDEGLSNFWIAKSKADKNLDKLSKENLSLCVYEVVTSEELEEYVEYKLSNCYFSMGVKCLRQVEGVPMGGKVSSQLAELFCMWKEKQNVKVWLGSGRVSTWMRYRDDIRVVLYGKWSQQRVKELVVRVDKMYGEDIEVLMEAMSYKVMNFLDVRVILNRDGFKWYDNNKNFDVEGDEERMMKLTRFPEVDGGAPRRVLVNTMSGVFKNTLMKCSTVGLADVCVMQNVEEFKRKRYRLKDVVKALYGANHALGDRLRERVRALKGWSTGDGG